MIDQNKGWNIWKKRIDYGDKPSTPWVFSIENRERERERLIGLLDLR